MLRVIVPLCLCLLATYSFAQIPSDGLQLWLRADVGVKSDDSGVMAWHDQSGNNHHALTATETRPVLSFDETRGIKAIRFDGWDSGMKTQPFQTFPNTRGTIIVVARVLGPSHTSGIGAGTLVSTYHGNGTAWQIGANADKYMFFDGVGRQGYFNPESFAPGWRIVTLSRPADSLVTFYFNGVHSINHPIDTTQPSVNEVKIGYNALKVHPRDSVTEVLRGDIAEIIIYGRALDDEELAEVHQHLLTKYHFPEPEPPFYKTIWFMCLLLLLIVSSTIAVIKWRSQRILKKQLNELLLQKQLDLERQRISREMHDDIGAGLTQIILMSDAAKRNMTAGREVEQIASTSRKLVNSMSEIIWSLNPENKTLEQLMSYLREQLHDLLEYSGFRYHLNFPDTEKIITLNNESMRTILLVTKEIVNNSIKHSKGTMISVNIGLTDSILTIEISDDGVGFDIGTVSSGNGLKNIRHRIDRAGGKAEITSTTGKGFSFRWRLELVTATTT